MAAAYNKVVGVVTETKAYVSKKVAEAKVAGRKIVANVKSAYNSLINNSQAKGVAKSTAATWVEGKVSSTLKGVRDYIPIVTNRSLRRAGQEILAPVKGASFLRGIGEIERIGAVGAVFTGISVLGNFNSGYTSSEAVGRSIVDISVSVATIAIGWSNPLGWAVIGAIGFGAVGEFIKSRIWQNN
ncbi:hypothetical protein [Clostridium thailandense]|uniref:hypothetical protein n=1 Tax=Clostridium thailandense TaxID=2794346 RepID=UPI0039898F2E